MLDLKKGDFDAFLGVLFDGIPKIITGVVVLTPQLGAETVFTQLLPSIGIAMLLAGLFFWWHGEKTKKRTNNKGLVSLPGGINAGRFFVWLFAIMVPVYEATGDAKLALFVGIGANIISSIVSIILAFIGEKLAEIIPSEALFGGLAGGALAWLTLATFNDMFQSSEMAIISMVSIFIILSVYLGKIKTKYSPALISVVVGVVLGLAFNVITFSALRESVNNFGIYIPGGVIISEGYFSYLIKGLIEAIKYLPIIIVFSFGETISNIQGIEQARDLGDEYNIKKSLIGVNIVSLISGFLGNPFCIGIWWGYPSWKEVEAGTSYQILHGVTYLVLAVTGVISIVTSLIPVGAVLPILIFIGLSSTQSAFANYEAKYYGIMAFALAIPIAELIEAPAFISEGAMLTSLLWASILVYIAKNKWMRVFYTFIAGSILSILGLIHTPNFFVNFVLNEAGNLSGIEYVFNAWQPALAYLVLAFIILFMSKNDKFEYQKEV